MKRWLLALPLLAVVLMILVLGKGLSLDPRLVDSPLIDQPVPAFSALRLDDGGATTHEMLSSEVTLLNVWASWCVACRQEHPLLNELSKSGQVRIVGLNYKDEPGNGRAWLERFGNPYAWSIMDRDGQIGIDYGVYGVPETFVIDTQGVIRAKRVGPITPEYLGQELLPLVARLQAEPMAVQR